MRPTRRRILALAASAALALVLAPRRLLLGDASAGPFEEPSDRGIGGTGYAPPNDESDRGIGGTGVIGTIRKFGSIVVNDLRIAYAPDVPVRIDGVPARPADLRIGQVVRVAASDAGGRYSTGAIDVTSEVVGPVERVSGRAMTVLGQEVSLASVKSRAPAVGDTVAVSGLRRNDGTVVASLVEPRPGASPRIAGPVALGPDGALRVGGLRLAGVDPALIGRRAVLTGRQEGEAFAVATARSEASLLPAVRTLSVESYVERRGARLASGSGFALTGGQGLDIPAGRSVRAVLTTRVDTDGRLAVEGIRANGRSYGDTGRGGQGSSGQGSGGQGAGGQGGRGPGGQGSGGQGSGGRGDPGGRVPMDFSPRGTSGGGSGGAGSPGGSQGNLPGARGGMGGFGGGGPAGGGMGGGGMGGGGMGGGRR